MSTTAPPWATKLAEAARVTAFIDIIGWSALTSGDISRQLAKVVRGEPLTREELESLDAYQQRVQQARALDGRMHAIVEGLREWTATTGPVHGTRPAADFWSNSHVTLVRASDCVFAHSTSFRCLAVAVSEMIKAGLRGGILLRAGMSFGHAEHVEHQVHRGADPRTRDITLIGDGLTTAARAEAAGAAGGGTRVFVHSDLLWMLEQQQPEVLVSKGLGYNPDFSELAWWRDFGSIWGESSHITGPSEPWSPGVYRQCIEALESGPEFEWNRRDPRGLRNVTDSLTVLRGALDELA